MNATSEMGYGSCAFKIRTGRSFPDEPHNYVRFVHFSPLQLQIRHDMNTSRVSQNESQIAALFRVASRIGQTSPAAGLKDPELGPEHSRFADLVAQPEKLEEALRAARAENDAFAASRTIRLDAPRTGWSPPPQIEIAVKSPGKSAHGIQHIRFSIEAPAAKSVQLVADFTDWEKCPLDLIVSGSGVWSGIVPLEPGVYAYRFIVDGQWCDDPRATQRIPNPYGSENALLAVP
jgi:hypothetical protein